MPFEQKSAHTNTLYGRTRAAIDEIASEVTQLAAETHAMVEQNAQERMQQFSVDSEQRLSEIQAISKYVHDLLTAGMKARVAQANEDLKERQRQLDEIAAHVQQLAEDAQTYIDECAANRLENARVDGAARREAVESLAEETQEMLRSYGWHH